VEAARAGEQGRGFAVVASEVRSLAGRVADAAKEIKGLISTSVDRVAQGTTLVNQAGITMNEVVDSIQRVTDLMREISNASTEQSAGVSQVGEAVLHGSGRTNGCRCRQPEHAGSRSGPGGGGFQFGLCSYSDWTCHRIWQIQSGLGAVTGTG